MGGDQHDMSQSKWKLEGALSPLENIFPVCNAAPSKKLLVWDAFNNKNKKIT